ncbi:hypothetical protein AAL_07611 [Moelleriella libera RCEF 2490]|uniref:Uncharacterized protein n=1 Tax=Moelleriella libera RCEF 2490 TaxID=1081109 RepID=A0A167X7B1_9HYPO|nr:hypothetical protein AAL_07611 [Moelleriella libera RCEF 2490]
MSMGRMMVPAEFYAMAAAPYDAAINYQHLAEENCRFLFGPDSKVTIVTASPEKGPWWTARLYKTEGGRRQLLWSASSTTLFLALRSIHAASANLVAVRAREEFTPRVPMPGPVSGPMPGPGPVPPPPPGYISPSAHRAGLTHPPPPPPPPFPLHTGIAGAPAPRSEAADGDLCEDGDTDDDAASVISESDTVSTPTSTVFSHPPSRLRRGQSVVVHPEDVPGACVAEKAGNGVGRQGPAFRQTPPRRQPPNGSRLPLHQAHRSGPPPATSAAEIASAKALPLREHDLYFQLQSDSYGSLTIRSRCYVQYGRILRKISELIEDHFSSFTLAPDPKPTLSQIQKLGVSAERVVADGETFVLQNKELDFSRITCGHLPDDLTVVAKITGSLDGQDFLGTQTRGSSG